MSTVMDREEIIAVVRKELPRLLREDEDVRMDVARAFANFYHPESESRFDRIMSELRADREENARKWDEQTSLWAESDRRWDEHFAEDKRHWDEQAAAEQKRHEESDRKWNQVHEEIMAGDKRLQNSITAIGARWGLQSESAFRNGLRAVLETSFKVKVENVIEFDAGGEVFGRADQVELDVVIHDGSMILLELKSSVSRPDMYSFERKIRFYEKLVGRKADRRIVISPMIDPRATEVAKSFHIECFTHSLDLKEL